MSDEMAVVMIDRAPAGTPTLVFGPFANVAEAVAWLEERKLSGGIVTVISPDVDTTIGAAVWC